MTDGTQYDEHKWSQLILESATQHPGYTIEATRRLVIATERQRRAASGLTRAIILLVIVQILAVGAQIALAVGAIPGLNR